MNYKCVHMRRLFNVTMTSTFAEASAAFDEQIEKAREQMQ